MRIVSHNSLWFDFESLGCSISVRWMIFSGADPDGGPKDCPLDPYMIVHDKCTFVDQQTIKLQEAPDMVPTGELPRHLILSVDRYLTGKVVPGSRIVATGIYSTFQAGKGKVRLSLSLSKALSSLRILTNPQSNSEIHLSLFEHLTFEFSVWKSTEKELEEEERGTSLQKKKKNSKRWASNPESTRSLREVSLLVFLAMMVSFHLFLLFSGRDETDQLFLSLLVQTSKSRSLVCYSVDQRRFFLME